MKYKIKQIRFCLFVLFLSLVMYSCGIQETEESVSDFEEEATVPVAQFQDMRLPVPMGWFRHYTFNEDWFYVTSSEYDREMQQIRWYVYRGRVADEFEPEKYITREGSLRALVTDREDNCYLFMRENSANFFLEKYDVDGELLWHTDCAAPQLLDKGECLTDGIVTGDGRVILYDYGEGGSAFVFGTDGVFQGNFTPQLDSLEGIAEGQEGRVYGYCITGEEPVFVNIEDEGEGFVCPIMPLQVYSGCEDGIYLCTGEGLWQYGPETGETKRLWLWDDEYVQIDRSQISHIFRGKETINLTCQRTEPQRRHGLPWKGDTLTFVSVGFGSRQDYPEKQVVTISRSEYQIFEEYGLHQMEELVRRYNRQGRKYKVVILLPDEDMISGDSRDELFGQLEMQLMRGEGPDLIEVQCLNVDNLAAKGALEDLTPYYEASDVVNSGEILEAVREAGRVMGQDMVVIPAFELATMLSAEKVEADDWTPLCFLELVQGDGNLMFSTAQQEDALWYCMGVSLGGHFVNYEKRECYFDSEEFRRVLEGCNSWEAELPTPVRADSIEALEAQAQYPKESEWLLKGIDMRNMDDVLLHNEEDAFWLGYPGWNGAETKLRIMDGFVMNSASGNKEGAWDFLEFLLSEELQNGIDWGFPARRDSFEEYLAYSYLMEEDNSPEFGYVLENVRHATQEDFDRVWEMLDRAVYWSWGFYMNDNPVRVILEEETGMYFAGDATLEDTVKKIQSRVTLYLNE